MVLSTDDRWDTMGEDLVQREVISTQVTPEMVAFMGELVSKCHQPDSQTACDNAALARVHPAAMGLISFYYRLEQAIVNFRRLMLRYETKKQE